MGKWLLLLWLLIFADAQLLGNLQDKISLLELRKAGIPEEAFQEAEIGREEALLYLTFWEDLVWFPSGRKRTLKYRWGKTGRGSRGGRRFRKAGKSFFLRTAGMSREAMGEKDFMKAAIFSGAGASAAIIL